MDERREPITVARPPRMRPATIAAGAGLLWGALCYSILWNGTPFEVDRRFFESVGGTLVLLPARLVLWAVRALELATDRTFELSSSTWVLAVATGVAGVILGVLALLAIRGAVTLVRR